MRQVPIVVFALLLAGVLAGCKTENKVLPPGMPLPEGAKLEKLDKPENETEAEVVKRTPKTATVLSAAQCLETGGDRNEGAKKQYQYDQAILAYKQAIELDPKLTIATIKLARLHEKMGQMVLAETSYQEALDRNGNDAGLWCELGMFHGRLKRFDKSIDCLNKAVTLEPTNQVYANNLGWSLARAGRFDESLQHFAKTLGAARAHYNLARMTRHMGREDLSKQHVQAALQIDPQMADARRMMEPEAGPAGDPAIVQVGAQTDGPVATP